MIKDFKIIVFFLVFCIVLSGCERMTPERSDPTARESDAVNIGIVPGTENTAGAYRAAAYDGTDFWAAGTGGMLIKIDADKQVQPVNIPTSEDLTGIWAGNGVMLVSGTNGTILRSTDGQNFELAALDSSATIFGITSFQGGYYAGAQGGIIFSSSDGLEWESTKLDTDNDIIGIAANENMIIAITVETDYFISDDGTSWNHNNYNRYYDGYAAPLIFASLKNMGDTFFVAGQMAEYPDMPFVMYTETGEVWLEKSLTEINGMSPSDFFPLIIYNIGYNLDQIVAVCNKGRLLTVTNCAECNESEEYGQADLYNLAFGDDRLLVVGDAYTYRIIDVNDVRQYKIKPEQAFYDFNNNGAVIIDVRTDKEWEDGHIPGALHIPVEEIGERLLQEVPNQNTELIFYCAVGGRAQTALEEAVKLGYLQAYSLGGISDWPYGIE